MTPLRVALIGYGLGGAAFHAPMIAAVPGLSLKAIVTKDAVRQEQARLAYPDARIIEHADALFDDAGSYDIVTISTPNATHASLAMRALAAGLHVVVDKPFAPSVDAAEEVVSEAQRRNRIVTVYQNRRWDSDFLTVQRLLEEGRLGSVHRFESRFERWRPAPRGGWRESSGPEEGGGILLDLGSHLVDQALVLFGAVTSVYAEISARRPGVESDDDVFIALIHGSGVHSHLHMSALAAQPGPRYRVLGDRAAYVKHGMDPQEQALRTGSGPAGDRGWGREEPAQWGELGAGDTLACIQSEAGAYQTFYAEMARAVAENGPAPVAPEDAIAGLRIIAAARESAAAGRVIMLMRSC